MIPKMSHNGVWPACVQGKTVEYQATVTAARLIRPGVHSVSVSGDDPELRPRPSEKRARVDG